MVDNPLNTNRLINQLPPKLQVRFNSLGTYVSFVISEQLGETSEGKIQKLSTEEKQVIQLVAFLYVLDNLLKAGTISARNASKTFENLGVEGFQVGSAHFTSTNHETRRGEILSRKLHSVLRDAGIESIVIESTSLQDLVRRMLRRIQSG